MRTLWQNPKFKGAVPQVRSHRPRHYLSISREARQNLTAVIVGPLLVFAVLFLVYVAGGDR